MFALLKKKNPYEQAARQVYASVLLHSRKEEFYEDYGVPDTFDGRFDMLLLHTYLILHRMLEDGQEHAEAFNQALFDATFADMDQTLREMGIGDMGIPKHMRKMMKGFNGRMHAYEEALEQGTLADVMKRNLYGTGLAPDDKKIAKMEAKALEMLAFLKTQSSADILSGDVRFEKE